MCLLIIFFIVLYLYFQVSVFKKKNFVFYSNKVNDNLRIVQVSDFHNNIFINLKRLKKDIKKLNPDLIFLTGDVISRNTKKFDRVERFLDIFQNYDTYFVQGNHELENPIKEFYKLLEKKGIKNLSNSSDKFMVKNNLINLCGNSFNDVLIPQLDKDSINILLAHNPNQFIKNKFDYDYVFSGHKHGGQVRLPFLGQVIDHGKVFFPKYSMGKYLIDNTVLYIDSGLGQSVYLRILDRVSYSVIDSVRG